MPRKQPKPALSTSAGLPPSLADPELPLPRLIVFDLDYTLWPFWVDTHVSPPLKPSSRSSPCSSATDKHGEEYAFYADVPSMLQLLPVPLGLASRTHAPHLAKDLLKMLHLPTSGEDSDRPQRAWDVFDGRVEIYPGSKITHFEALHKKTGVQYEDMLFFDDESRNQETEKLGVTMMLVRDGMCWDELVKGVEEWRRRRGAVKS